MRKRRLKKPTFPAKANLLEASKTNRGTAAAELCSLRGGPGRGHGLLPKATGAELMGWRRLHCMPDPGQSPELLSQGTDVCVWGCSGMSAALPRAHRCCKGVLLLLPSWPAFLLFPHALSHQVNPWGNWFKGLKPQKSTPQKWIVFVFFWFPMAWAEHQYKGGVGQHRWEWGSRESARHEDGMLDPLLLAATS